MPSRDQLQDAELHLTSAIRRDVLKALGVGTALLAPSTVALAQAAGVANSASGLRAWSDYVDALKPAGAVAELAWFPKDELIRAEVYRQLVMNIAQGYIWYFQSTPDHPDWMPFENSIFMLQPNPDGIYHLAPVDGRGTYRIVGNRGTNPVMGFATGSGMLGTKSKAESLARGTPGFNNYDADGMTLGPDGSFEVIFSSAKPAGWAGDWRFLDPRSESILIRQFSYDWGNERDGRFAIERLDKPALKPRLTASEIAAKLDLLLGDFVKRFSSYVTAYQEKHFARLGANVMELTGFEDMGNSPDWPQKYWRCFYDLNPGEALLIETDIPKCKYWNVQINDLLWNQVEFAYRQSSLNGHQARLDADGKFRAVLSLEDPGVPNWLDTGGHTRGMLVGRWHGAETHPMPMMKKMPIRAVRKHLPANTPVVSNEDRDKALRKRNIGVQLRRRW